MKSFNKNNESMHKNHQKDLGFKLPENYFEINKKEILTQLNNKKVIPLYRRKWFISMAASIALLVSLVLYRPTILNGVNNVSKIASDTIQKIYNQSETEVFNIDQNDVSLASLFVKDDELDDFVNNYVVEEMLKDNTKSN